MSNARLVVLVAVIGAATFSGTYAATRLATSSATATEPPANLASRPAAFRDDGNAGLLSIDLTPAISQRPSADMLEFRLRITSAFGRTASIAVLFEVVDADGNEVLPPSAPATFAFPVGGPTSTLVFPVPNGLSNGYYLARATCAGTDGALSQAEIAEEYFRIVRGVASPISPNEWLQQSNERLASGL